MSASLSFQRGQRSVWGETLVDSLPSLHTPPHTGSVPPHSHEGQRWWPCIPLSPCRRPLAMVPPDARGAAGGRCVPSNEKEEGEEGGEREWLTPPLPHSPIDPHHTRLQPRQPASAPAPSARRSSSRLYRRSSNTNNSSKRQQDPLPPLPPLHHHRHRHRRTLPCDGRRAGGQVGGGGLLLRRP